MKPGHGVLRRVLPPCSGRDISLYRKPCFWGNFGLGTPLNCLRSAEDGLRGAFPGSLERWRLFSVHVWRAHANDGLPQRCIEGRALFGFDPIVYDYGRASALFRLAARHPEDLALR